MNNRVRYLLEGAISFGLLGVSFWLVHDTRAIQSRRCQQDECGWMAAGDRTFRDLVLERRWDRGVWGEGMHQTRYGWMNPTLGKLFFGLVLYADGYELPPPDVFPKLNRSIGRLNRPSDWYADRTVEHHPYLVRLRTVNAWVMALCAVSLYHLARMFGGRLPAVLAALMFAATPLVRLVACQVGTDSLTLLLSIVSVAVATRVLGTLARGNVRSSVWRTFAGFCVVGLLLGLGVSTKLNGAVSCIVFGTATVVLWVFGKFRRYPA